MSTWEGQCSFGHCDTGYPGASLGPRFKMEHMRIPSSGSQMTVPPIDALNLQGR